MSFGFQNKKKYPTVTHWFFNNTIASSNITSYAENFIFKPPANIAGKACKLKLVDSTHQSGPESMSIFLRGLPLTQNVCVDPAFSDYGSVSATTFYQLVGDENKSNLIATNTRSINGNYGNPEIIVQVPEGPTEVTLGMFSPVPWTGVMNSHFIISFTPID